MQPKSTKLNLKLLPHPDRNLGLGNKVKFYFKVKRKHMNTTAQCVKTVILSNLEREYVITGLLLKEIRFFGIDNNGYKFK